MKKRMLSLLLVLIMALQPFVAVTAWADEAEEDAAEPIEAAVVIEEAEAAEELEEVQVVDEAESEEIISVETELEETSEEAQLYKGWVKIRGEWYYYDNSGLPYNGWLELPKSDDPNDDKMLTYYCEDGRRYYGGVFLVSGTPYLFGADGVLCNGWANIPYLDPDTGAMQDLWYYCNSDGTSFSGWKKDSRDWYYYVDSVPYFDGIYEIGGDKYGFDKQGRMLIGWHTEDWMLDDGTTTPHWYYFGKNGIAGNGWVKDKTDWYYLIDGSSLFDGVYVIDGNTYAFDRIGRMATGTYYLTERIGSVKWTVACVFESDGRGTLNGWKKVNGNWFYYENGIPVNNTVMTISGVTYGFDRTGKMATGWMDLLVDESGKAITVKTHFDKNGKGTSGWIQNGSAWYYLSDGVPVYRNCVHVVGSANYGFDKSGKMVTGWFSQNIDEGGETLKIWYYFSDNGKGFNGWKKDSKNWYYLNNGVTERRCVKTIGGEIYGFDKVGIMLYSTWLTDGGHEYYFQASGKAYKSGTYTIDGVSYTFNANGWKV